MTVINEMEIRGIVVGVFQENCYIIASQKTKEAIIIDPGDEPERILELAKDMGVTVKVIASSHGHGDHVMAISSIKEVKDIPFLIHNFELPVLQRSNQSMKDYLGSNVPEIPNPDGYVVDNGKVSVSGLDLHVIHTPGHTPGSVSYFVNGLLFSGDTLFRGSIGRTDLPGGNYNQIMQAITTKLLALPNDTIVLPGHMLQTTIGDERYSNPFILDALEKQQNLNK
jgi:hydroxyacylglutathione hydrolase